MPVCTLGSQPRPAVPATLVIDPRRTVSTFTPGLEWINPFLPFLPTIVIDTPTFCAIDPPGDPGIDATDLLDLLSPTTIGLAALAAVKIEQLIRNYVWYSLCECTSTSTPAAPTAPTAPAGTPVLNPPRYFPLPGAGPCLVRETGLFNPQNLWQIIFAQFPLPTPTPTRVFWTATQTPHGTVHNNLGLHFGQWNAAGTYLSDITFQVSPPGGTGEIVVEATTASLYMRQSEQGTGVGTDEWNVRLDFYCNGGSPATPYDPCCPPDPALALTLERLNGLLTLVQRQAVPFGYVPGSSHASLTDSGELTVADLIGAKVSITSTYPDSIGEQAGTPTRLFAAGWIQWGSTDGYGARVYLDQVDTLSFPSSAGAYTRLAYSLPPGVQITILELEREP